MFQGEFALHLLSLCGRVGGVDEVIFRTSIVVSDGTASVCWVMPPSVTMSEDAACITSTLPPKSIPLTVLNHCFHCPPTIYRDKKIIALDRLNNLKHITRERIMEGCYKRDFKAILKEHDEPDHSPCSLSFSMGANRTLKSRLLSKSTI